MAGSQVRIGVGVTGARGAASELDKLRDKFTKLQKQGAKGFAIGAGVAATNLAFNAVGTAISKVTGYLGESADAFRADAISQGQLRTSLAANDAAYRGNAQSIEKVLQKRVELGFSDDEQRASLAALIGITKDSGKALDIQRTAMDLARLKGMDLASATQLLGKVAAGNLGILARYGIQLEKGATATEALASIQKMAAGQAESWAASVGKTEVAQIRAAEASEKFGKQIDRLEGFVFPLATGAIEGFANSVDALFTNLDRTAPATSKLEASTVALETSFLNLIPPFQSTIKDLRKYTDAQLAAEAAADSHGDALIGIREGAIRSQTPLDDLTDSVNDLTDAERKNIAKTKAVADTLDRISDIADTLPAKLDDLNEAMFGKAQREGDIAQARKDLADLLDEQPKKKHVQAWKIWAGQVAEARQRIFDLEFEMKKTEGPEALDAWLRKQRGLLAKTDQKARDYLNTLIAINSLKLTSPFIRSTARISGGLFSGKPLPLYDEGTKYVPETGPAIVHQGEAVIPKDEAAAMRSGSWGGGATTLNINISTPVLTPGSAEAVARYLEPIITRAMQRRGQLGAARAF